MVLHWAIEKEAGRDHQPAPAFASPVLRMRDQPSSLPLPGNEKPQQQNSRRWSKAHDSNSDHAVDHHDGNGALRVEPHSRGNGQYIQDGMLAIGSAVVGQPCFVRSSIHVA
jgi:hypothetical protein